MPNHVTTRCTVTGPTTDLATFRARMIVTTADEKGEPYTLLDFDKIIPAPAILSQIEESTVSEYGARLVILRAERGAPFETMGIYNTHIQRFRDEVAMRDAPIREVAAAYLAKHPEYETAGRLRLQAILETGFAGWYSWNIANWGTKWNCYSFRPVSDDPLEFLFETAWGFPEPVFAALAREFPALQFKCLTFDEGWNFGGQGYFNPPAGEQAWTRCEATDELYERVYGEKYERDPDDDEATA